MGRVGNFDFFHRSSHAHKIRSGEKVPTSCVQNRYRMPCACPAGRPQQRSAHRGWDAPTLQERRVLLYEHVATRSLSRCHFRRRSWLALPYSGKLLFAHTSPALTHRSRSNRQGIRYTLA
jgi:hypothetical protein